MIFDIYGRYRLQVLRQGDLWVLYRLDGDRRRQFSDFAIPAELGPEEIAGYLDDMLHEAARPGREICRLA